MKIFTFGALMLVASYTIATAGTFKSGGVNLKRDTTIKTHRDSLKAKTFGGRRQYRTWSIGANVGVLSPFIAIGGSNNFTNFNPELGYGISVRKQLAPAFGLQFDALGGQVAGNNTDAVNGKVNGVGSFKTKVGYTVTVSGVVQVATIDFIRRKNAVNFYVSAGAGLIGDSPALYAADDQSGADILNRKDHFGASNNQTYQKDLVIPIGAGIKIRLSERTALNLGYTMNFLDDDNLDGVISKTAHKDKFSYAYGGLEFSLGSGNKKQLDWINPVAMMYDELKDPGLRKEVEALKVRISNVEKNIQEMKVDTDGDGVPDYLDKCPNTPAGSIVDGGGCPIKFPVLPKAN